METELSRKLHTMKLDEFPQSEDMQQCPCCDYFSLAERGKSLVCPVCFWEDDCGSPNSANWDEPSELNDGCSLRHARSNFANLGAWHEKFSSVVIGAEERSSLRYKARVI